MLVRRSEAVGLDWGCDGSGLAVIFDSCIGLLEALRRCPVWLGCCLRVVPAGADGAPCVESGERSLVEGRPRGRALAWLRR